MFGGMGAGTVLEDLWELRLRGKRWHWSLLACTGNVFFMNSFKASA